MCATAVPSGEYNHTSSRSTPCCQRIRPGYADCWARTFTRPFSSKASTSAGRTLTEGRGAVAHAETKSAHSKTTVRTWAICFMSTHEALHRGLQQLVVRAAFGCIAPDLLGILFLPARPQHFADVRGDLRIRAFGERPLQEVQAVFGVSHAIEDPAHA